MAASAKTAVLLLDFDGVVLSNPKLWEYQRRRSSMFVRKHTNMTHRSCEQLHTLCYNDYGHTVSMLNSIFRTRVTLEEYNDFVFNKKAMGSLKRKMDQQTIDRFMGYTKTFEACEASGVDWAVFTNANQAWVQYFIDSFGWAQPPAIHFPTSLHELKPKPEAYDKIESFYSDGRELWFVDDQKINLTVPTARQRWVTMHFTPDMTRHDIHDYFELGHACDADACPTP